jgi:hypothetical protein
MLCLNMIERVGANAREDADMIWIPAVISA